MKNLIPLFILVLVAAACGSTDTDKKHKPEQLSKKQTSTKEKQVLAEKRFDNGIVIYWTKKGKGEPIASGDVVDIDYRVSLKNNQVVDGNHLLKKSSFPFLVGFNLQTPGWDIAIQELVVGDEARILIPSPLARGEKGIKGLVPPNADNWLDIRVIAKRKPSRTVDGVKVWLFEENKSNKEFFGEGKRVTFHAMASSPSHALYANTFRTNQPITYTLSDYGLVPGLRKALINVKKADRMFVVVPAEQAYKNSGYMEFVKPGEPIFYNILVLDVTKS